ncbi:choice-of-anchor G family protein [Rathayibacter sp. VKM Ac-2857]|uniref:choice-of-anchor G family protein n=1 Tax=Rathayibacter sp. VKM Ac-2857 TaxID=2739020 RepID=UPI0015633A36|nr:choice-of-anchor G family protein [Rathayibacter sp. VKM Ac-2857]NQX15593.1 choice-of-anchor G family protein [Rathayibacter sp. VKM Ac-2857]
MTESHPLESSGISEKKTRKPGSNGLGVTRRTVVAGAAWSVPAIMVAQSASAASVSCYPVGTLFQAQARGILLSGFLGGVNLDGVVALQGERALVPDQSTPTSTRFGTTTVTVLNTLQISATGLTGALSTLLSVAAPGDVGVLDQYAFANIDGNSRGAAGAVDNQGQLELNPASATFPDFATIDLRRILTGIGGTLASGLVGQVTDLRLQIGAVTGRAAIQSACVPSTLNIQRDYQVTRLNLVLASPLLGQIVSLVTGVLNTVDALPGVGVNATAIFAGNIPGGAQPIQAQLGVTPATITIDLLSLLGPAPGQPGNTPFGTYSAYFNSLPPNSTLFVDNNLALPAAAINTFTTSLISTLSDRLQDNITVGGTPLRTATGALVATINGLLNTLLNVTLTPVVALLQTALLTPLFTALTTLINIDVNAQNRSTNPPGPAAWDSLPARRFDVAALYIRALGVVNLLDLFLARGSVGENTPQP